VTRDFPPPGLEIESVAELDAALTAGIEPRRLRLQDLDLRDYHGLDARTDLAELVVLGGRLSPGLDAHLRAQGAILFPDDPNAAPIRPYRAHLYSADELYAALPQGYSATPDAVTYAWYQNSREHPDVFAALLQAIHDDSISDALAEFVHDRAVVGVMGVMPCTAGQVRMPRQRTSVSTWPNAATSWPPEAGRGPWRPPTLARPPARRRR
jgi:hypothetical protein